MAWMRPVHIDSIRVMETNNNRRRSQSGKGRNVYIQPIDDEHREEGDTVADVFQGRAVRYAGDENSGAAD